MSYSKYFALLALTAACAVNAAGIDCAKARKPAEVVICANNELVDIDWRLAEFYDLALLDEQRRKRIRSEQRAWIARRDACGRYDCLVSLYLARILELSGRSASTLPYASDHALDDGEGNEICAAVAKESNAGTLDRYRVRGELNFASWERALPEGFITPTERQNLLQDSGWRGLDRLDEIIYATYRLKLRHGSAPSRFIDFPTGTICASDEISSVDRMLARGWKGAGFGSFDDPDGLLRDVYLGAGDQVLYYRGHYFRLTATSDGPRMLSWIRLDGDIRPICTFKMLPARLVSTGKGMALCGGIASGRVEPLPWVRIPGDVAIAHGFRHADSVEIITLDVDGDGRSDNVARFEDASKQGCELFPMWVDLRTDDLAKAVESRANDLIHSISGRPLNLYQYHGGVYFDGRRNGIPQVVRMHNGRLKKVCGFRQQVEVDRVIPMNYPTAER